MGDFCIVFSRGADLSSKFSLADSVSIRKPLNLGTPDNNAPKLSNLNNQVSELANPKMNIPQLANPKLAKISGIENILGVPNGHIFGMKKNLG